MVSGTRERTIASWAALALVVGLSLSAAPAAHSATETATADPSNETTQTPLDESVEMEEPGATQGDDEIGTPDLGDETPTESTTPTPSPTPTPTTPTSSPEPDPSESTNGQDDGGNGQDSSDDEEALQQAEINCDSTSMVSPGDELTVTCTVIPSEAELILSDGSRQSPHGTISFGGNALTFTANPEVPGSPQVTAILQAIHPDEGVIGDQEVTFTVQGGDNSEPTTDPTNGDGSDEQNGGGETEDRNGDAEGPGTGPSPSQSGTPDPPEDSGQAPTPTTPVGPDAPSETEPGWSVQPEPTDVTSAAQTPDLPQLPGAPGAPSIEQPQSVIPHLPVPGMPDPGSESIGPEPTADASEDSADGTDDSAGEGEPEDDEGGLAQTGPEQVAWSGSLAASAIVLGITALALSRRQTQRSLGP